MREGIRLPRLAKLPDGSIARAAVRAREPMAGALQLIGVSLMEQRLLLSVAGLATALWFANPAPLEAAGDEVAVDDGGTLTDRIGGGRGMPSSSPRVRPILAAHPNQYVVICVAGCDGRPKAVQILPRPTTGRVGAFVPSAAKSGGEVYGPPRPGQKQRAAVKQNDVVCLAGCVGKPGQVVQHLSGLPPRKRRARKRE